MNDRTYLFEKAPIPKALASFAIPTIISQIISMIYNIADTMFIGKTDNPYMVAAATMSFALYMTLNAFGQLFGIGGGVLTSKLLGEYKEEEAKKIGTFSFYCSLIICILYSLILTIFMRPILSFLGTSAETYAYSKQYATWVVCIGGFPTILSVALSHLIRSEGYSKEASLGLSMGGVINIILDPLFMFVILKPGQEVLGAAIATCISNVCAFIYFMILYSKLKNKLVLSLDIRNFKKGLPYLKKILTVGFPSFIAPFLGSVANASVNRLASGHSDIAIAAFGIAKKIDMLPMNMSLGLCQGMVALVSYNYANKNFKRMNAVINTTRIIGIGFAVVCIAVFEPLAPQIVKLFIHDPQTVELGAIALRRACLSVPFMILVFHTSYTYQSMGYGMRSLTLTVSRQALAVIPIMFIMDKIWGIKGLYFAQLVADVLVMSIAGTLYIKFMKKLKAEFEQS